MTYKTTTKANRERINVLTRQMLDGLKVADNLRYNYSGLTARLRNQLAAFLSQHGETVTDHDTGDRVFPADPQPWLTGFAPFEMSAVVTANRYFTQVQRLAWDRATGQFSAEVSIPGKAAMLATLPALAVGARPITHVKYEAVLVQQLNTQLVAGRQVFREIDVATWPDDPVVTTVSLSGASGPSTLALLLIGAQTFTTAKSGKLAKASYRTRDALLLTTLDGSPFNPAIIS